MFKISHSLAMLLFHSYAKAKKLTCTVGPVSTPSKFYSQSYAFKLSDDSLWEVSTKSKVDIKLLTVLSSKLQSIYPDDIFI